MSIKGFANGDSTEFWEGARQGRLLFQKCQSCGVVQFPPRHHCASCWDEGLEWIESTGRGVVESVTIVHRAPIVSFRDKVPYAIAAIAIEEGPRMITNLLGEQALNVAIGDAVEVEFAPNDEGIVLPQFRPA